MNRPFGLAIDAPVARGRLAEAPVLVVGDVMLDRYWFGEVERISPEAPVPVVRVTREEHRPGGAANVAVNVRALGAPATLLTVLGDDEPARQLAALVADAGVALCARNDPAATTTVKLRVTGRSQQLLRVDFERPPDHEMLADMLATYEAQLGAHRLVLFSDYGKGGLTHIPAMIARARAAGVPVLIDPKGSDWQRYAGASAITPNRAELAQVIGAWTDAADLSRKVRDLCARLQIQSLLLTRSEEGMSLFDAGGEVHVPSEAREVFDVTGAGDTVIATLAAFMAAGVPLRQAMPVANRAGGIVVGRLGTASVDWEDLFPCA